jgi:hypothetical protein
MAFVAKKLLPMTLKTAFLLYKSLKLHLFCGISAKAASCYNYDTVV